MDAQQPPVGEGNVQQDGPPPPADYSGYPGGTPPGQYGPQKKPANIEGFFEKQRMVKLIGIGIFFILIGAIFFSIAIVMAQPQQWDEAYDDDANGVIDSGESDDYIKDVRSFKAMRNGLMTIGLILISLGVLALVFMLLGGAIFNSELDKYAKLGMFLAGGIIIYSLMYFLSKMMEILPWWLPVDLYP